MINVHPDKLSVETLGTGACLLLTIVLHHLFQQHSGRLGR